MKKSILFTCGAVVLALGCVYYLNQPRTYEDCIIENLAGVENTQAARMIRAACQKKFPELFNASPPGEFDDIFFSKDAK